MARKLAPRIHLVMGVIDNSFDNENIFQNHCEDVERHEKARNGCGRNKLNLENQIEKS